MVVEHAINLYILNSNDAETINYPAGMLVNEALPFLGNAFMYSSDDLVAFLPFRCSLFSFGQFALCFG